MEKDQLSRKLAVILHADVVDSTALVRQDETLAHQHIQDTFQRLSETIKKHEGVAHEIRGDALVAEFAKASDSVGAAVEFQAANSKNAEKYPEHVRPVIRIGIAMGEVVIADNTVTGEGVILAQRLEQLADPAGVCIQGAAYETIPKRLPFEYENIGDQRLKGFDEPIRVFKVKLKLKPSSHAPEPETLAQEECGIPNLPEKPSIAVLPFTNMSGDPEQEYFSDGITEDITTALTYFSGLFVIARNSSFAYKGKPIDARQIASELGVRYLLEGSVRRSGDRLRINGQLINAVTGSHIWAEKFDGDLNDIFELQDEITRKIVGSIAPQIELAEVQRCRGLPQTTLSSYELSLLAKSQTYDAFRTGDAEQLQTALETAQLALDRDLRNTHALWISSLASMEQYLYRWGEDPDIALERALQFAENLVHVDATNADGYGLRGAILVHYHEFDRAIADFERSLLLNSNASINLFFAAWGESLAGLTSMAKEHAELGLRLSPRESDIWLGVAYLALTQASFAEEQYEEAMKWGHLSIQLHSKAPIRRTLMVACCAYTGNLEQAKRHADELSLFAPEFLSTILRGDMRLYKMDNHNTRLVEGLHKVGIRE